MEKKLWLYRIQPTRQDMLKTGPTPEEDAIISEHFGYLKDLTEKGVVLLAGRTLSADPDSFGTVIYLADDDNIASSVFSDDPAVKARVFCGGHYPFSVALLSQRWQQKKA